MSCSKTADFKYESNTAYISTSGVAIDEVREIPWKVGKGARDLVSRGMRFSFELPNIEDQALEVLYSKKGIDSWLIKLSRKQGLRTETLGFYSMMLVSPDPRDSQNLRFSSPKKGSIGINYAASSISMRLNELPCPALNHRYIISSLSLKAQSIKPKQNWVVSGADDIKVNRKVELISYSPVTVNGGMELKGDYSIELAFYNQKSKRRLSSFVELEKVVSLDKEEVVAVEGCENYIVPERGKGDSIKKFKFGR